MNEFNGEVKVKSMIANYISEDNRFQELDEVFGQENILVAGIIPVSEGNNYC